MIEFALNASSKKTQKLDLCYFFFFFFFFFFLTTTVEVIHYGFGKNMWDITPLDHITMMYKVSLSAWIQWLELIFAFPSSSVSTPLSSYTRSKSRSPKSPSVYSS